MKRLQTLPVALVVVIAALFAVAPQVSAQSACVYVKGVEAAQSLDTNETWNLDFTLSNTNSYKVTVDATFFLTSDDGTSKSMPRTLVLEAGEERKVSFSSTSIFGSGKMISAADSSVRFTVWKCD